MDLIWAGQANAEINEAIGRFAAERIWGDERKFENFTSLGIAEHGKLVGAVIFHNYDPRAQTIEISGAADTPRWLTRKVLKAMYAYPFEELGLRMVVQRNSEHAHSLNSMLRRFGMTEYRIEGLRGPDEAEIVFTLTRDQWLNNGYQGKRHGQEVIERTQAA